MLADLLRELLEQGGNTTPCDRRLHALGFDVDPDAIAVEELPAAKAQHRDTEAAGTGVGQAPGPAAQPLYRFKVARLVASEDKPVLDAEEELKGFEPLSDEELSAGQCCPEVPDLLNLNTLIRVLESLAISRESRQLDTRRLSQRIARQRALTPLPRRSQRVQQNIDWVVFAHCPALLGDQLALCELLLRLPDAVRPLNVARLDGNGLLLDERGRELSPRAVPGGRLLIVADPQVADFALTHACHLLAPGAERYWLSPVQRARASCWDRRPARSPVVRGLALMRALLAPQPVIEKSLLRRLRLQLGLNTGAEIEFWQHRHAHYNPVEEWGQMDPAQRPDYKKALEELCQSEEAQVTDCLALIDSYMRLREPLYYAEASQIYRHMPLDWVAQQSDSYKKLDRFLARLAVRGRSENHAEASAGLLGMACRLPDDLPLTTSVASAVDMAQKRWVEHYPNQEALVGQRPERGIGGKLESAYLGFDGRAFTVSRSVVSGQLAALHCSDQGVVVEQSDQRRVQPLEQPFLANEFRVHTEAKVLEFAALNSDQLWWADAIAQSPNGLQLEVSGHHITLDNPEALQPLWPGKGVPAIDDTGLFVDEKFNGVQQRFRYIPPGRFLMGSPEHEPQRGDDEAQHEVRLSDGFWLADTGCNQQLWQMVNGDRPSHFSGDKLPVEQVSWDDVQRFCRALNKAQRGATYQPPSEAQWEYACRAGAQTAFWWGDTLDDAERANFDGNYPYSSDHKSEYRESTVPVYSFAANPWGLYQMHGNVWEWCTDRHGDYAKQLLRDPTGPPSGELRVLRGGSWYYYGQHLRAAIRDALAADMRYDYVGFRLSHPVPRATENTDAPGRHATAVPKAEQARGSTGRARPARKSSLKRKQ